MSMSQEEIEALMNGLDVSDEESPKDEANEQTELNTDEIEELISQTESLDVDETPINENEVLEVEENSSEIIDNSDIDQLLKDLDVSDEDEENTVEPSNDILESIDALEEIEKDQGTELIQEAEKVEEKKEETSFDSSMMKDWTDSKINEGVFPFPADKDTKVVNQLSQVANDSEEKVGQIFDVLSLALDNNNDMRGKINEINSFLQTQVSLLESLNNKFPNIGVFNENLDMAKSKMDDLSVLSSTLNDEDMKIFEAMELMQFNDINRQKIERVMSVIRKLSIYLNNLFEDDSSSQEIVVARHIHGDDHDNIVDADDIEKLIEEYDK